MRVGYKQLGAVLGTVAVLGLGLGGPLSAQGAEDFGPDREGFIRYSPIFWSLDARGGISLPLGDLGDVADPGPSVGAGWAYFLNPNFALRLDGNLDFWGGRDAGEQSSDAASPSPDILRFSYFGGFEAHLTDPTADGAQFALNLGAGGVTFNSDEFVVENFDATIPGPSQGATTRGTFSDTYFALQGGARLGINLSEVVALFLSGQAHWMFLDEEDSAPLAAFYAGADPFDSGFAIPIQGGLRINVP